MKILSVIALVLLALVAWWKWTYPTSSFRYRMTVTVETPEGIKSGTAVREVISQLYPALTPPGGRITVKGEAVVVDLGARGKLFALLKGAGIWGVDYGAMIPSTVFPIPGEPYGGGALTPDGVRYYGRLKQGRAVLTPDMFPMLVRFRDLNDPATVENVYEMEAYEDNTPGHYPMTKFRLKADNFEKMFGQGVKLKDITIEITDDPVTKGVERILPWFNGPDKSLGIGMFDPTRPGPENYLTSWDFQREIRK